MSLTKTDKVPEMEPEEEREPWRLGRWGFYVHGWQHWREWFGKDYNWRNFTVLRFDIEAGPAHGYKGRYVEVTLGLIGFVVEFEVWDTIDRTAALGPVIRRMHDWEERHDVS